MMICGPERIEVDNEMNMELTEKEKLVRKKLIACARERRSVTYTEVSKWLGFDRWRRSLMDILVPILDNINKHEHTKGRPLLTALVVRADIGFPSTGFFDVASELDVFKTSADNEYLDRIAFLHSEVQRVFDAHARFEDLH